MSGNCAPRVTRTPDGACVGVKITTEKLNNVEAVDSILAGKHKDKPRKALSKLFKKVQKDLKEFENINKKALEQFEAFSVKEELDERLDQLQRDREKIVALIEDLDEKKGEQVSYSFKQMKKNFSSIFNKIVPGGKGELVLVLPENVSEEEDDGILIVEATGLEIEISFTGLLAALTIKISVHFDKSLVFIRK